MHILLLTESFLPETKSQSALLFDLSQAWTKSGHKVSVITRRPRYNLADGTLPAAVPARETMEGIDVYRLQTPPLARTVPFVRGFEHFLLALLFFIGALRIKKIDAVFVYSPPLPLALSGYWLGRLRKTPLLVNVQDLYPRTVVDLGLLKNKLIIRLMEKLERFIYRRSGRLVVHSEMNRRYLIENGARPGAVTVVRNWVDTENIKPGGRDNAFSRKYGLTDKFVVSFAGSMGFAQGLEAVIGAAKRLQKEKEVLFILVGDGALRPKLKALADENKLENIKFIPTQPVALYPLVLQSSDVSLVPLARGLTTPIPGKIAGIMAAGAPIIAGLPIDGEGGKLIEQNGCGIRVAPEDPDALANAVLKLYNCKSLREEMGRNGRRTAETIFSRKNAIFSYEKILAELTIA